MSLVKVLISEESGHEDSVVVFVNDSLKLLYKEQTRMNDRMRKAETGLILIEHLFFILFNEDKAVNGSVVCVRPKFKRRFRWGPALDIEVQLETTTVMSVLKEEYGWKGAGWFENGREIVLGMRWIWGRSFWSMNMAARPIGNAGFSQGV
jgi:hypothetical protein